MQKESKILITGATGYIGGRLVPLLIRKGYSVRCMARHPERLAARGWKNAEIVFGEALKYETLKQPLTCIDVAYYLIRSVYRNEEISRELDCQAAYNFARAASHAGIKRIIYLGALGQETHSASYGPCSRESIGALLKESSVPVTEFRASIIIGSGGISFEIIRYMTERLPIMICPRWFRSLSQPIAIRDVLAYLFEALIKDESVAQTIEIGGKDVLSCEEMIREYARIRGLKRYLIRVPVLSHRLSSYWVDLVTPIPAEITRPWIERLQNNLICQTNKALTLFSIKPLSYTEALQIALKRLEDKAVETTWFDSYASIGHRATPYQAFEKCEGMMIETRHIIVHASAADVFKTFCGIGGERGWYYANILWWLRGLWDRVTGGIGMRRGRRHPDKLKTGDVIDFWRVEAIVNDKLLRLRAEMKIPGKAWLQFEIDPQEEGRVILEQTAFFEPKGIMGHLYWYLLLPFHYLIFPGLAKEIKRRAEEKIKF